MNASHLQFTTHPRGASVSLHPQRTQSYLMQASEQSPQALGLGRNLTASTSTSNAVLQGLHAVGLHDGPGWSGLHFLHLAKDQLRPCLRGRLGLRLDHAETRDRELALLHLAR